MNQRNQYVISILFAVLVGWAGSSALAQTSSSTVTFEGKIEGVTCTPVVDDVDKSVKLPTISASTLRVSGNTAGSTPFSIRVQCTRGARSVRAYFDNAALVDQVTGNLNLMPQQGQTNATNVQVRLAQLDGTRIIVGNRASMPVFEVDASGTTHLNYQAMYYATGEAIQGIVRTQATYTIEMP